MKWFWFWLFVAFYFPALFYCLWPAGLGFLAWMMLLGCSWALLDSIYIILKQPKRKRSGR